MDYFLKTTELHRSGPTKLVTREMVYARTRGLALRSGRTPSEISQDDYEQAKRELTGESDRDRQDAILDSLPPPGWSPDTPTDAVGPLFPTSR